MAAIEERAAQWARDWYLGADDVDQHIPLATDDLIAAYLAGSAQAQKDYSAHDNGK